MRRSKSYYRSQTIAPRPPRRGNWRVISPTDEFTTVNLLSRQSIDIVLDKPSFISPERYSPQAEWVCSVEGNFLQLQGITKTSKDGAERVIYSFGQIYDFSQTSSNFREDTSYGLGNIVCEIVDPSPASNIIRDAKQIIITSFESDGKSKVMPLDVVFIDPKDHYGFFRKNQKIVVLLEEGNGGDPLWKYDIDSAHPIDIQLEGISWLSHQEAFEKNVYFTEECPLPYSQKKNFKKYVFHLNNSADIKESGVHFAARLTFSRLDEKRSLNLMLKCDTKDNKSVSSTKNSNETLPKLATSRRDSTMAADDPTLFNPIDGEILELSPRRSMVSIKLAKPSVFNSEFVGDWQIKNTFDEKIVYVRPIQENTMFGHPIQETMVSIYTDAAILKQSQSSIFLGQLLFHSAIGMKRNISIWFSPNEIKRNLTLQPEISNYTVKNYSGSSSIFGIPNKFFSKKTSAPIIIHDVSFQKQNDMDGIVFEEMKEISPKVIKSLNIAPPSGRTVYPNDDSSLSFHQIINLQGEGTNEVEFADKVRIVLSPLQVGSATIPWAMEILDKRLMKIDNLYMKDSKEMVVDITSTYNPIGTSNISKVLTGAINFHAGHAVKNVKFYSCGARRVPYLQTKKQLSDFSLCLPKNSEKSNIVKVQSFVDDSAIHVQADQTLFVMYPELPKNAVLSGIELHQIPLDDNVFSLPVLNKIRDRINPKSPWYPSNLIFTSNGSVAIRAVSDTHKAWTNVLLTYANDGKPVHVADVVFTSHFKSESDVIKSPFGKMTELTSITKTMHVFVSASKIATLHSNQSAISDSTRFTTILNPIHNSSHEVHRNGIVKISLKQPPTKGTDIYSWFPSTTGAGLVLEKMERECENFNFFFKTDEKGTVIQSFITFKSSMIDESSENNLIVNLNLIKP